MESRSTAFSSDIRRSSAVAFAIWTALGLVESTKDYTSLILRGTPRPLLYVLRLDMPWWYTWFGLTFLVIAIARRAPLYGEHWRRNVAVHAISSVLVSVLHIIVEGSIYFALRPKGIFGPPTLTGQWLGFYNNFLMTNLLTYWATVGGFFAFEYYRRLQHSLVEAARLEAHSTRLSLGLAHARMQALRMELNPHFLFNTLNAISGLVRKQETGAAVDMLARLGDLLRSTLDEKMPAEITVDDELALLDRYLDIERVRFGDRLTINTSVAADARTALVPTLLLQPLVENAIRHGVTRRTGAALVRIDAWRDRDTLHLEVRDSGDGVRANAQPTREGIGLKNSRARIAELYGTAGMLTLGNDPHGGACARIVIPFRESNHGINTQRASVALGA